MPSRSLAHRSLGWAYRKYGGAMGLTASAKRCTGTNGREPTGQTTSGTAFPALTSLAATFNPELSKAYGIAIGEEARYRGKDVLLGPRREYFTVRRLTAEILSTWVKIHTLLPQWWCLTFRGFSKMAAACVKHFALNNQEEWRAYQCEPQ